MDSEDEIQKKSETLAKDQGWSKLKALSVLHSSYLSERRLEEALRVKKIIDVEESKSKYPEGFSEES